MICFIGILMIIWLVIFQGFFKKKKNYGLCSFRMECLFFSIGLCLILNHCSACVNILDQWARTREMLENVVSRHHNLLVL